MDAANCLFTFFQESEIEGLSRWNQLPDGLCHGLGQGGWLWSWPGRQRDFPFLGTWQRCVFTRLCPENNSTLKFIYSEKTTKFNEIFKIKFKLLSSVKNSLKISSYFCSLLRLLSCSFHFGNLVFSSLGHIFSCVILISMCSHFFYFPKPVITENFFLDWPIFSQ